MDLDIFLKDVIFLYSQTFKPQWERADTPKLLRLRSKIYVQCFDEITMGKRWDTKRLCGPNTIGKVTVTANMFNV